MGPSSSGTRSGATWNRLVGDETSWADVVRRYGEPHRAYHTLVHIEDVLGVLEELGVTDPAVLLAAVLHDVVYDPTRGDNEAASADYARHVLAHLDEGTVERTAELILATASHEIGAERDPGRAALLDADLAILAAPPDDYEAYSRAIRREYAHVRDDAYRAGRARVLETFLSRSRIFFTDELRTREEQARANLRREIDALRAVGSRTPRPGST